jgi:hypothetical protein
VPVSCNAMVGALVTADLDTLTTIHTPSVYVPRMCPEGLVRLHESLPTHNSFLYYTSQFCQFL